MKSLSTLPVTLRPSYSSNLDEYIAYHNAMYDIGDIDPAYPMLRYLCDRFELNPEQRHWLAFLYATCYCGPTVYWIYNEFPDYENVDPDRLERWFDANYSRALFQSDRKWIKIRRKLREVFESYRALTGRSQVQAFNQLRARSAEQTYLNVFDYYGNMAQFGRYSLFLFTEAVHVVTGYPMRPDTLVMKDAESCRNGLCMVYNMAPLMGLKDTQVSASQAATLQRAFNAVIANVRAQAGGRRVDVWNVETTLCAYKKLKKGQRYLGFYIDRQADEIKKMERAVPEGVDWSVLWDFRREFYQPGVLRELSNS